MLVCIVLQKLAALVKKANLPNSADLHCTTCIIRLFRVKKSDKILRAAMGADIHIQLHTDTHTHCISVGKAVRFVLKTDERNNGIKKQILCSKCLISSHELVNLKEYDLQMCFSKSKLPGFCGGELISPSMTLDRKGLLLLL